MNLVILLTAGFLTLLGATPQTGYRILTPGCHHYDEVKAITESNWYGLSNSNKTFTLKSVNVSLDKCHDVVVDEEGDTTGVLVISEGEPLFLIQSPNQMVEGKVASLLIASQELEPGKLVGLGSFDERHFSLAVTGNITDEGNRQPYDLLIKNYQLKLYDQDANSQILVEFEQISYEGLPMIYWAGDLDRDGSPDLILDIRNHYNVSHYALYLSSAADEGQMVKFVAELRTTGC